MAGTINHNTEFGVPIFDISLADFKQHQQLLIEHFLGMRESAQSSRKSNRGDCHSDDKLFKSEHPWVVWLVQTLFQASGERVKQGGYLPTNQDVVMSGCWANINDAGDWNSPHSHLPDIWSGVCYIDVNSKDSSVLRRDGDIIFINPLPLSIEHNRAATKTARPKNGSLFLFRSYLLHMVAPHFDTKPRITVAFNMKFKPAA
jgi:uncharacterized protein (TIGR02466 family)